MVALLPSPRLSACEAVGMTVEEDVASFSLVVAQDSEKEFYLGDSGDGVLALAPSKINTTTAFFQHNTIARSAIVFQILRREKNIREEIYQPLHILINQHSKHVTIFIPLPSWIPAVQITNIMCDP